MTRTPTPARISSADDDNNGAAADGGASRCCARGRFPPSAPRKCTRSTPTQYRRRFRWLSPTLFIKPLTKDLRDDASSHGIFGRCGPWDPDRDTKLRALETLLTSRSTRTRRSSSSPNSPIRLLFLEQQLKRWGVNQLEGVTGELADPTAMAWRFSPVSNEKRTSQARR